MIFRSLNLILSEIHLMPVLFSLALVPHDIFIECFSYSTEIPATPGYIVGIPHRFNIGNDITDKSKLNNYFYLFRIAYKLTLVVNKSLMKQNLLVHISLAIQIKMNTGFS